MTRRRAWLLAGAIGLVLLLATGAWLWQVASRPATAEDTALAYLRALESGDVDALAALSTTVPETVTTAFAAADEHIADAAATSVDEHGDTATADVMFVLAGEKHSASLTLSQADGRWRVDASGLGSVHADLSAGAFFTIGAASFPIDEDAVLFPAVYTVAAAPVALLEGEAEAIVLPGSAAEVSLDVALLPAATTAAQTALDEHLAACTAGGEEVPTGCGIRLPWGTEFATVDDIRYRIETPPVLTLTPSTFDASGGVLVATVTGTGQDGTARTTTYRTASWLVRGDVSFTETSVVLSPW